MKNIGIIGSGAMGIGIAQVFATAGYRVRVYDHQEDALNKAASNLDQTLHKLVDKRKIDPLQAEQTRQLVEFVHELEAISASELVIEAIIEDLTAKKQLFAQLENIVSTACILASNTSSLSITSIAAACQHPERVIGIHFFNPAPVMALVEIIPAIQTRESLAHEARSLIQGIGKLPVLVKDSPGFIVNRVARPFYGEALRMLEEGLADASTIDLAMKQIGGFRMGPFELMDFIGHDVNYKVTESVFSAFYFEPRYKPSLTQKRLCEAGYLGRKSGRGFYDYSSSTAGTSTSSSSSTTTTARTDELEAIHNRILIMLFNEAADALYLRIANREDLDLAMTKGVNYPKGLLQWADEYGIERIREEMDELYNLYREDRYRLSPLLRKMASEGTLFYS